MKEILQKLKAIEPSEETVRSIKARIDARIGERPIPSPYMRINRFIFAGCSVAVLALAFSFTLDTVPSVEAGVLSARMAISPTAHTKSGLALSSLEKNSILAGQAAEDPESYERINYALDISRGTLDTLKLMGEEDKYTMEECLSDYNRYYKLLVATEGKLASSPLPADEVEQERLGALKDKVHDAIEEAEDRLGKYPTKN